MRFRYRLLLGFLTVLLLPLLLLAGAGLPRLRADLARESDRRLLAAVEGMHDHLQTLGADLQRKLAVVIIGEEFAHWQRTGERSALLTRLQRLRTLGGFDVLEAGDAAGRVVARGHNPGVWGEDKSGERLVAGALGGRETLDFANGRSGMAVRAARPLYAGGHPAGTLTGGYALGDSLAARGKLLTGFDFAFVPDGAEAHGTFPGLAAAVAGLHLTADTVPVTVTVRAAGVACRAAVRTFRHADGTPAGRLAAALPLAAVQRDADILQRDLGLVLLAGLGLALFAALLSGRMLTRPLDELRAGMARVGAGDLSTRLPIGRHDEFGVVAVQFNATVAQLAAARVDLQTASDRLLQAEKLAAAGELVNQLAHEIRNPLNAIAASCELLRKEPLSARGTERLAGICGEVQRLGAVLTGHLQAAAPLALRRREGDPSREVHDALAALADECTRRCITVRLQLDTPLCCAYDGEHWRRLCDNLLRNALEAMPGGGTLTVTGRRGNGQCQIDFTDTGAGMTDDERRRATEAYFTTKDSGSGLGLAYARRVAEAHNGTLRIRSGADGTTVSVCLPLAR